MGSRIDQSTFRFLEKQFQISLIQFAHRACINFGQLLESFTVEGP